MTSLGLTMIGVFAGIARSSHQDVILMDQASMIQLPLQREDSEKPIMDQILDTVAFSGRLTELQNTLHQKCETLDWVTEADCTMGRQLVDFILAQKGGETGNDLDVAKRVVGVTLTETVYGSPGQILGMDTDHSGDISATELRPSIEEMGVKVEKGTADIMAIVDTDRDDKLSMKEVYQFGRGCLVLRQFLPEVDGVNPFHTATVDLLPTLDKNTWHLPAPSPENLEIHKKFQDLSANISAECHALYWPTEADCKKAETILNMLLQLPIYEGVKTLEVAQAIAPLKLFLHTPDQFAFGLFDMDGNRAFTRDEFMFTTGMLLAGMDKSGREKYFDVIDQDGAGNVTREDVYDFIRGCLVIRHFIPEIDAVSPGRAKDGSPMLSDSAALNMALHIIDPPPLPKPKLAAGPKLLYVFGIMIVAFTIQWFVCAAKPKLEATEDDGVKPTKTVM